MTVERHYTSNPRASDGPEKVLDARLSWEAEAVAR